MALIAKDDFNRADGALGANWTITEVDGGAAQAIEGQQVRGDGGAGNSIGHWNADAFPDDQYASIRLSTFTAIGTETMLVGGAVRKASGTIKTAYFFRVGDVGGPYQNLYKCDAGILTQLASSADGSLAANDVFKINAQGTAITVLRNGSTFFSTTDSDIASGSAGIFTYRSGAPLTVLLDDFSAGDFLPPDPDSITADDGDQGETLDVTIAGTKFDSDGAAVLSFSGTGIAVNSYTSRSATQIVANVTIAAGATVGFRDVIVTNPSDAQVGTLAGAFEIIAPSPSNPLTTRCMRASALTTLRPWLIAPPLPDSTLNQGDRQHIAYMYCGILATGIVSGQIVGMVYFGAFPAISLASLESVPEIAIDGEIVSVPDVGMSSIRAIPRNQS